MDWTQAAVYATNLLEGSRWSRTVYSYQKAIILIMSSDEPSKSEKVIIRNLMRFVLNLSVCITFHKFIF